MYTFYAGFAESVSDARWVWFWSIANHVGYRFATNRNKLKKKYAKTAKEEKMNEHTHRNRPAELTGCQTCGKILKFGRWIELTLKQLQNIQDNPTKYSIVLTQCPICKKQEEDIVGFA